MGTVFFGFVTFFTLGCTPFSGNIQVVKRKETSIECASNSDLSFKFYSNVLKKFLTIAECDFNKKECALLTTTNTHVYTISYTGRGGILVIRDLDKETIGTYQCYETYNPLNLLSTNISQSQYTDETGMYSDPTKTTKPRLPEKFGHIKLGVLKDKSIECSSNVDITFQFISNKANATVTIIAECDLTKKTCTMLKPSLHNKYNLSYTGIGGVLHINSLNESFGTYICRETYNPIIYISIDVMAHIMDAAIITYNVTVLAENNTEIQLDQGATNNSSTILKIVLPIIAALVMIGIVCVIVWLNTKAFSCAASNDRDNLEMSNAIVTHPNEEDEHNRSKKEAATTATHSTPLLGYAGNTSNGDSLYQSSKHADLDQNEFSLKTTIDDLEGNPYPAIEVFKHALQYLHGHLLKALKRSSPTMRETDIRYVITVPAIWTAEAKRFMKESALQAGINDERLTVVVDSMAAATWCTRSNTKDRPVIDLQTTGSKWLVVNIGGGTASVLACQVLSAGEVKVLHQASGGAWRGTYVDQQFMDNLDRELGAENLDKLRREHIGDYLQLLNDIEENTGSKYIFLQDVCVVRLPNSLSMTGKHEFETAKVKAWFYEKITSFIAHIKKVLQNNISLSEVTSMVLVGRFAGSEYVQNMFQDVFTNLKLIVPQESGLLVLKGAVLYGHNTVKYTFNQSDSI
ncbi:uncharacterized protein LOC127857038 isoform X2 [Dreissena polymorpha]|nr:uncharacterized protein LOC127857038 isoform X2 [Dreissena polymorpha]XP_052249278.1 uncharacterized protein LOC127857038 isoform X2 [Dreissena polymorpha]XP_052249279.1 uncharacterized protein LOC127857038 isoform X2 [Dreissena polymorpha]XP_052249280.1 uncharacterized protein LOC127857038 isoform X2 [Dreissena polymorpha]